MQEAQLQPKSRARRACHDPCYKQFACRKQLRRTPFFPHSLRPLPKNCSRRRLEQPSPRESKPPPLTSSSRGCQVTLSESAAPLSFSFSAFFFSFLGLLVTFWNPAPSPPPPFPPPPFPNNGNGLSVDRECKRKKRTKDRSRSYEWQLGCTPLI